MDTRKPKIREMAFVFAAALGAVSCSYGYGRRELNTPVTFSGSGWDSGLAYGDAIENAGGRVPDAASPARVSMNCYMYAFKPLVGFAGGAIAASAKSTPLIVAALAGAAVFALLPNCYSTLTYDVQPGAQNLAPLSRQMPRPTTDGGGLPLRPVRNKSEILVPPAANEPEQPPAPTTTQQ